MWSNGAVLRPRPKHSRSLPPGRLPSLGRVFDRWKPSGSSWEGETAAEFPVLAQRLKGLVWFLESRRRGYQLKQREQ